MASQGDHAASGSRLTVTAFGVEPGEAMPDVADATVGLLKAVAEAQLGSEAAAKIDWKVGPMGWRCDTCGLVVEVESMPAPRPDGWTNDGKYDYCEACTTERAR